MREIKIFESSWIKETIWALFYLTIGVTSLLMFLLVIISPDSFITLVGLAEIRIFRLGAWSGLSLFCLFWFKKIAIDRYYNIKLCVFDDEITYPCFASKR